MSADKPSTDDWRIRGDSQSYLQAVALHYRRYFRWSEAWDHDHCAFCWAKFMVDGEFDTLDGGWTTDNEYNWICDTCFHDFRDRFGWHIRNSNVGGQSAGGRSSE